MPTFTLEKDADGYTVRHTPSTLCIATLRYKAEAVALRAAAEALAVQHPSIATFDGVGNVRETMGSTAYNALFDLALASRRADWQMQIAAEKKREQRKRERQEARHGTDLV